MCGGCMSDFEQALVRAAQVRQAQLAERPAVQLAIEAKMRELHRQLSDTGGYGDIGWSFDLVEDMDILCRRNNVTRAIWRHYSGDGTALYPVDSRDAVAISRSIEHAVDLTAQLVVGLLKT